MKMNKTFQKTSLRNTITSKLKSEGTKKFTINHLIPILFFFFLSIFIFRGIIGSEGIIIQGDFIYSPDLEKFSQYFYPMWDSNINLGALSRLPRLLFYLPFIEIGFLFNMGTTDIMVMGFIFCEFLAGISMYYSSRYILSKTYRKIAHKIMITKIAQCPNCKHKEKITGIPGKKVIITCPKCNEKGVFYFPKKHTGFRIISKITKTVSCPNCKHKEKITGIPGKKVIITCPKCNEKGVFIFPEEQKDFKKTRKTYTIEVDNSLQDRINIASLLAGLAYMWSFFLLRNYLFPQHRFAYALTPFIILSLMIGLEKKKAIYIILTGFLWSLACADMHWTVHGAILLFSFILYHFVLEFAQLLPTGKLKAFKTSFFTHLKYLIILVGSFISFSAYWFLQGLLMGATSRYPATIFAEMNERLYTQTYLINLISDWQVALYIHTSALFDRTLNIFSSSGMQNLLFLMGLGVFIFSMMALIMRPENRYVLFFSILTIITIFLASIPMFSQELYFWFITKAPLSGWYGWVFKRPMISQFLMLSLPFLIGFSVVEIITRIKKSKLKNINLKKGITVAIICFLLLSILLPKWPLATGDHSGWIKPVKMPNEFEQVNSWLEKEQGDFKVLWLPKYFGNNISWYQGNRINKDIAGLASSKPTYVFWGPAKQPNGYGIHFFGSSIYTLHDDSLILSNATRNFGKFLAPLGIKYIIFHDDNATSWDERSYNNADDLFNVLKHQDDLELIMEFGFIYVFENKYYDEDKSSIFFTTSNDFLVFGGLGSLATLNSIPDFHSRDDGLIFGNQKRYEKEDIYRMIDSLIFTQSGGLEEVAFTFADDKYFIVPFDYTESLYGNEKWTKIKLNNFFNYIFNKKGNFGEWEKDYGEGIAYTWSPGTIRTDYSLSDEELIIRYDFETDTELDDFKANITSNLNLSASNNSISGDKSIMGTIAQGEQYKIQYTQSELFPLPKEVYNHRISLNLAAENVSNVQVTLGFYDAEKKTIETNFLLTRSGTFAYTKFEQDIIPPSGTRYYSIQIRSDQNPITDSYWWIDDIKLYNLDNITTYTRLNMNFDVGKNDNYEFFMRYLKSENGGKINIYLDGKQITSLNTYDTLNAFVWEKLNSFNLTQGSHTIAIENVGGFNAINLIAAVPEAKMEEYYGIAMDFLEDNALIYILEAESDFYFKSATISDTYGNLASSAKVLSLDDDGEAWLPVQVLRSGNYSMSIKSAGGSLNNTLMASLGNNSFDLGYAEGSNFRWNNITNISLTQGYHDLRFSISPPPEPILHLSFERGWNSTNNSPENWSSAQPEFSMCLDPLNRTDGEHSLMITTNSTGLFTYSRVINEEIILESNNYYEAKIDVRTENMNKSHVKIMGYNETSTSWEDVAYIVRGLTGAGDWREYTTSFLVPENITQLRVILNAGWVLNTTQGNATMWFDDFTLLRYLEEKNADIDLVVLYLDETNRSLEQLFKPSKRETVLEYKKIDATKYKVRVSTKEPFTLGFAEAYDEFWVAYVDEIGTIESIPLYSMLNGFFINKTGNFTVIVEYLPQQWFDIGISITGLSIVLSFGYLIWIKRRNLRKKLKVLYKMIKFN